MCNVGHWGIEIRRWRGQWTKIRFQLLGDSSTGEILVKVKEPGFVNIRLGDDRRGNGSLKLLAVICKMTRFCHTCQWLSSCGRVSRCLSGICKVLELRGGLSTLILDSLTNRTYCGWLAEEVSKVAWELHRWLASCIQDIGSGVQNSPHH